MWIKKNFPLTLIINLSVYFPIYLSNCLFDISLLSVRQSFFLINCLISISF
ncbi:hypothetical protein Hamer_G016525 [Homarus americanus]|uniref:Uncharacterized protein n=1 Tax=Homarus americanus TaxID=6706 RepID=A0A8J5JP22_HOMAM|nr:hypothetical protein Hamer_G016525 [Homarus americanus]